MEFDQFQNSVIYNNVVEASGRVGIYMLRSEFLIVKDNRIINPSVDAEDGIVDGWSINLVGGIFADYHI